MSFRCSSKRLTRLVLTVLVVGVALALGSMQASAATGRHRGAAAPKVTTIRVALNSPLFQPGLAFVWLGNYTGYYKQAGVNVQVVPTAGPSDAFQRLVSGAVDVALPPPASVLTAAAQGRDLGLVTPFVLRRHGQYQFAVLPDSPIKSVKDIPGKKIGVTALDNEGVFFAKYALEVYGHRPSAVQFVPVGNVGQAATELKEGHVDALALPTVQYAQIQGLLGFKIRLIPNPPFESKVIGNAVWVRKQFVQQHPDVVRGFLTGFAKDLAFYVTNPRAALEIHFKMYPQTIPKGKTAKQAVDFYLPFLYANLPTFRIAGTGCPKWGCNEPTAWKLYAQYLGLDLKKLGDLSRFYTNEFIDAVNNKKALRAVMHQARKYSLPGY